MAWVDFSPVRLSLHILFYLAMFMYHVRIMSSANPNSKHISYNCFNLYTKIYIRCFLCKCMCVCETETFETDTALSLYTLPSFHSIRSTKCTFYTHITAKLPLKYDLKFVYVFVHFYSILWFSAFGLGLRLVCTRALAYTLRPNTQTRLLCLSFRFNYFVVDVAVHFYFESVHSFREHGARCVWI